MGHTIVDTTARKLYLQKTDRLYKCFLIIKNRRVFCAPIVICRNLWYLHVFELLNWLIDVKIRGCLQPDTVQGHILLLSLMSLLLTSRTKR